MSPNVRSIGSTPRGRHNPSGAEEIQPIAPASESDLDAFRDTASTVRIGIWILLLGFGGFLLWASFAPLGEGVPTQGTVIVDTKRKPVQHRVGGIVKLVSVKEGQWVNEGDALFELEEEGLLAQLESSRQLYFALRATESRLRAEQSNERLVSFPPELVSLSSDQIASGHLENQRRLFASRRQALDSEQAAFEQSRLAQEAKLKGLKEVIEKRQQARNLLEEQRAQLQTLASQGYVPRHRYLELERQSTELDAALQDLRAAIETTERTIREIRLRADQRLSEYRKEVDMQLADVRRDVEGVEERFRASKKSCCAPSSGRRYRARWWACRSKARARSFRQDFVLPRLFQKTNH